jgi:hypothetical protein
MASFTDVSIASAALIKLGDDPITSLTDNTNRARMANRFYHPVRQAVLRKHVWNDSIKRASLAQSVTIPAFEYGYQYALPSDFLRMIKTDFDEYTPYKIEGRFLLTNEGAVSIQYVYDNETVAQYDFLHAEVFIAYLAAELSTVLTGKESLTTRLWQEVRVKLQEAMTIDGQEDYPDIPESHLFIDVRR